MVVAAGRRGDNLGDGQVWGLVRSERRPLGHVAHPQAPAPRTNTVVGRQHLQEGRLASPVRPGQSDAIALVESQGQLLEQGAIAEGLADVLTADEGWRRH